MKFNQLLQVAAGSGGLQALAFASDVGAQTVDDLVERDLASTILGDITSTVDCAGCEVGGPAK